MTNTYFKSKEQYFQFRKAFAAAANSGTLQAEHFIFLNIVRGIPHTHGFTPVTRKTKLFNGANIWQGLDDGVRRLRSAAHSAKDIAQIPQNTTSQSASAFRRFIEPFIDEGDEFLNAILMNILCELEETLSEHKEYYTSFGEGVKIARKMVAEDLKPKNYQEFMRLVEEITNNDTKKAA